MENTDLAMISHRCTYNALLYYNDRNGLKIYLLTKPGLADNIFLTSSASPEITCNNKVRVRSAC